MAYAYKRSLVVAYIIAFSSLTIILTFVRAEVPFPLLPYLKFDFAEVPIMVVLLLIGPFPALITEVIHWVSLTLAHGWVLGPLMKFLAVTPTIVGFWMGIKLYKRIRKSRFNFTLALTLGILFGIVLRVVVCSLTNIAVFLFVMPEYLNFAEWTLKSVGIAINSAIDVWVWTLLLTGIFNALHVPISSVIAAITFKGAMLRMPNISERAWITKK
jgi:riboflavin transporter FmnP